MLCADDGINAAKDWNNKYGYKIIIISQRDHFGNTLDGFLLFENQLIRKVS